MNPATEIGRSVDSIALYLFVMAAGFTLLVVGLLVYFSIKYRKGSKADRRGRKKSSIGIEVFNASVVAVLGLIAFFWSAKVFLRQYHGPEVATELYVTGKQWMWIFQYPGGPRQINRIKVPVGKPVRMIFNSEDVIHSFFIPDFRLKQDAVPGHYTSLWFEATRTGIFPVYCSEFCGTSHSAMRAEIEVIPEAEFEAYRQQPSPPPETGAELYRRGDCASCHETAGRLAPSLVGFFGKPVELEGGKTVTADENYVRRALLEPAQELVKGYGPLMPTYKGQLSDEEITTLIEYLKNLKKPGAER